MPGTGEKQSAVPAGLNGSVFSGTCGNGSAKGVCGSGLLFLLFDHMPFRGAVVRINISCFWDHIRREKVFFTASLPQRSNGACKAPDSLPLAGSQHKRRCDAQAGHRQQGKPQNGLTVVAGSRSRFSGICPAVRQGRFRPDSGASGYRVPGLLRFVGSRLFTGGIRLSGSSAP